MSTGYKKCLYSDLCTQCMDKFVKKKYFYINNYLIFKASLSQLKNFELSL